MIKICLNKNLLKSPWITKINLNLKRTNKLISPFIVHMPRSNIIFSFLSYLLLHIMPSVLKLKGWRVCDQNPKRFLRFLTKNMKTIPKFHLMFIFLSMYDEEQKQILSGYCVHIITHKSGWSYSEIWFMSIRLNEPRQIIFIFILSYSQFHLFISHYLDHVWDFCLNPFHLSKDFFC